MGHGPASHGAWQGLLSVGASVVYSSYSGLSVGRKGGRGGERGGDNSIWART